MQELLTLRSHLSSLPDSSEVRVARSFDFCVVFCRLLSFCPISFGHCVACPSNYSCRLPFCHFQTHPICDIINKKQSFNQYYKKKLVPGCICYLVFDTGYNVKKNNDNEYRQGRRKGIINSTLRY